MRFLSYIECKLPDSITQQQQRFSTSIFHDLPNIDVTSGDKWEIFVKNPCHFGSSFPAKALDPKHAAVLSGRGACVLKLGRHDEASSWWAVASVLYKVSQLGNSDETIQTPLPFLP